MTTDLARITGADWAAAPLGTCARCLHGSVPVLGALLLVLEVDEFDPLFDVPLCPGCHPFWPHHGMPDLAGRTWREDDLALYRSPKPMALFGRPA